ncbi:TatD family hydrolase [Candidatus Uhrbacteria bacterium]|nr:TatD family hydrolase [Candidatus Uhrbacteria bacterium]
MTINLRLIDAHCHVNFSAYRDDPEAVISRALDRGIGMIAVGTQRDTSRLATEIAAGHDGVWAIVGLHPVHLFDSRVDEEESSFTGRAEVFDPDFYRRLVRESNGKVVGLGECGLDYFHRPEGIEPEVFVRRQVECFGVHLDLAEELDIPVMIHCRDAHPEAVAAYRETRPDSDERGFPPGYQAHEDVLALLQGRSNQGHKLKGDVHCFTGTWEQAQAYLDLGLHLSFAGIVTYPPRRCDLAAGLVSTQELARRVPLDRILAETDSPYLTPVPHRGEWPNEPANVEFVAAELARIHGLSPERMNSILLENTIRLFGLK